uniref:Ovule protein n=1 Tax=Mesocestoides corti TaxID=53468 RepID=A0A5K3FSL8_MESCO
MMRRLSLTVFNCPISVVSKRHVKSTFKCTVCMTYLLALVELPLVNGEVEKQSPSFLLILNFSFCSFSHF